MKDTTKQMVILFIAFGVALSDVFTPSSQASFSWLSTFGYGDIQNYIQPHPLHACGLTLPSKLGLAVTKVPISTEPSLSLLEFIIYWKLDRKTTYAVLRRGSPNGAPAQSMYYYAIPK